jgi:hypothetical protein
MDFPYNINGRVEADLFIQPYFELNGESAFIEDIILYQEGKFEFTVHEGADVVAIQPLPVGGPMNAKPGDFRVVTLRSGLASVGVKFSYYDYGLKATKVLETGFNLSITEPAPGG